MISVPQALSGTAWDIWLSLTPPPVIDSSGANYHAAMTSWLSACPGTKAPLTVQQQDQLRIWLVTYLQRLNDARIERPGSSFDKLAQAVTTLVVGAGGSSLVFEFGSMVSWPIGVCAAVGSGLVGVGYAIPVIRTGRRKGRKHDLLQAIITGLNAIADTSYIATALPAPRSPAPLS